MDASNGHLVVTEWTRVGRKPTLIRMVDLSNGLDSEKDQAQDKPRQQEVKGKPKLTRTVANNTFGRESTKNKWNIGALI